MRDKTLPLKSLKCPSCGKDMEKGRYRLDAIDYGGFLWFTPSISTVPRERNDMVMKWLPIVGSDKKEGFRCKECGLYVIDKTRIDYRGRSALKGKNEFSPHKETQADYCEVEKYLR